MDVAPLGVRNPGVLDLTLFWVDYSLDNLLFRFEDGLFQRWLLVILHRIQQCVMDKPCSLLSSCILHQLILLGLQQFHPLNCQLLRIKLEVPFSRLKLTF